VLVVLVQTQLIQMLQEELGLYFSLRLLKMDTRLPTSTFVYINTILPFGTFTKIPYGILFVCVASHLRLWGRYLHT